VISRTTPRFRAAFAALPKQVQARVRHAYRLFLGSPSHLSLRFKIVHSTRPIYSARIGLGHRALAVRQGDELIWFWVGSHAEYDELLRSR
jgi:hypothetical protein